MLYEGKTVYLKPFDHGLEQHLRQKYKNTSPSFTTVPAMQKLMPGYIQIKNLKENYFIDAKGFNWRYEWITGYNTNLYSLNNI